MGTVYQGRIPSSESSDILSVMASRFRRLVAQIALVGVGAFGLLHAGLAAEDKGPAQSPVPTTPGGRDGGVRGDSPMTSGSWHRVQRRWRRVRCTRWRRRSRRPWAIGWGTRCQRRPEPTAATDRSGRQSEARSTGGPKRSVPRSDRQPSDRAKECDHHRRHSAGRRRQPNLGQRPRAVPSHW